MRADADAFSLASVHDAAHGDRVAGMEAAGDARRTDDLENRVVVADVVGAEPSPMSALRLTATAAIPPSIGPARQRGRKVRRISYCL